MKAKVTKVVNDRGLEFYYIYKEDVMLSDGWRLIDCVLITKNTNPPGVDIDMEVYEDLDLKRAMEIATQIENAKPTQEVIYITK